MCIYGEKIEVQNGSGDLEIFRKIKPCDPDISPNKRDPETHLGSDPPSFLMLYLNLTSKKFFGQPVGEISEKLTLTLHTPPTG